jgi:hypothetical protein
MSYRTAPRFWRSYQNLPEEVRRLADSSFQLLRTDPNHPSIHFKKVGRFWSARVGLHYRALAVEQGEDVVCFWIGSHAEYDQLIANA